MNKEKGFVFDTSSGIGEVCIRGPGNTSSGIGEVVIRGSKGEVGQGSVLGSANLSFLLLRHCLQTVSIVLSSSYFSLITGGSAVFQTTRLLMWNVEEANIDPNVFIHRFGKL